ncbi:MAG: DUF4159 domain-containing protein [Planctomycetota bacterium]|jgi:hypothetical protein
MTRTILEHPGDLRDWKHEVLRAVRWHLDRRELLKAAMVGAAALAGSAVLGRWASRASAAPSEPPKAVKTGTFFFPRMMFHVKDKTGDQWNTDPIGDAVLRKRLAELTNVNVSQDPVVVKLADLDHMCRYPFVFATSEGYFKLPDNEEANLKEFLMRGGFLHADDCVLNGTGDRFFRDYVKMIRRLFPQHELKTIPKNHELYHCYFDFPDGALFLQGNKALKGDVGLFEKGTGRIMTLCSPWDYHCGWTCMFFTKELNEQALRMGINIIIYYLTH